MVMQPYSVTELVEVPSIDYAESQKKYQSARIDGDSMFNRLGDFGLTNVRTHPNLYCGLNKTK